MPFSKEEFDSQRDWEVINTVLRTPEVEPITRAVVEREANGTYRTHDGREYRVERAQSGTIRFTARDGSTSDFVAVGGKAFMQQLPGASRGAGPIRARNERELTMIRRFLEPMTDAATRDGLVDQFVERGGTWLDFTIGEGRVLGFEIRVGGTARLGGPPPYLDKGGVGPAAA